MYSAGSIAPSNARDFPSSMPPDHTSPVSASSAQNPWERQSYSNSNNNTNSISRDRFPSSGKKELWGSEHRSSSQRSSSSFSSNNKRRAPGFTGRHGAVENGRYGVAVSRPLDSSSIRSSENGKAERDTFTLSGGYISSPNADKHIKDTDGLHFRDTHISPVDVRTVSSPHYDPSPRNGNQNSFEILGSREGERLKSSSSHYSWGVSHRDQEFREKNVGRPDHYRRACPLPKLDSSREWSVENRELLEGRIDRYGSASNREPLFSEVCKDQSRHEWRNRDRGLYGGLSSRMPTYPSKSHPRDIGIASARSEALGVISPKEETMVQNSQMHELNAEDSLSNSKKRPRLTWGQGLAKYEKEKIEEDPLTQKTYENMKISEKDPLGQKIFDEVKTWDNSLTEKKGEVDTEERCKQNGDLQSQLSLSHNEQLVDSENNDVHLEQGDTQEQCKQNEGLQSQFNVAPNEHIIMTDTKENDIQGEHCHIQGLCKQNGVLQSQLNISVDEHIVIEVTGKNIVQGELCHTPSQELTIDCRTEEFVMDTLVRKHSDFSKSGNSAEGFLRDSSLATDSTEPSNLQCVQSFMERCQGTIPNVSKVVLMQYVKKVEVEIDSLEKQIIKLEDEQGISTGYEEKMDVEIDVGKEIPKQNDDFDAVIIHSRDSGVNSSLELPERFLDSPLPSIQQAFPEASSVSQSGNVPIEELPNPSCSILEESVQKQRLENEMCQDLNEIIEQDRSLVKEIVVSIPSAISSDSASHIMQRNAEDIRDTNRNGEGMVSSLLLSNQETAQKASDALAHLYPACINLMFNERRIYGVPEEADIWKYNAESHKKKRKVLESKVAEEKKSAVFGELALVIRNRTKKELWKRGLVRCLNKDRSMDPQLCIPEQKIIDASIQPCSVKPGCTTTEASPEEVQVAKKLLSVLPIKERGFLRMPSMILGKDQRKHHNFETNNALVEDPVAAERERKIMNPWSAEEKKIFLEKYLLLGKNLRRIATFLEYKTVADCVQFYYLNQKSEDFEKVHRKHLLKKRRDSRSSALYLATTISSNRQCEADAACLEGLSLVAAAAAAMSSTRVVRASLASSKVYRERTLNKQVLGTCALTGMAGNGEQIVSKTPRSWNSRSHRGLNGDSESQWTDNERELFLKAVPMFGKDFHNISLYIGTKNQGQCKSFFSKARKRLALDQLVEMYKAAIEAENEQKANTECGTKVDGVVKHAKAQKSSPDVDMQSPFLVSEIECVTPRKEPDWGNTCASSDMKPLGEPKFHPDLREAEDVKTGLNIDAANKQGPTPDVDSAGISCANQKIPMFEESQVCGELKPDLLNVKAEPLVSSNSTNVSSSNATSSLVHVIALPVSAPVLAPTTPSVSSVVPSTHITQPTHIKEKSSKGTETRTRREPTSWTQDEKDIFIDVLRTHGKNWERLRERLPAKSLTQIKTYFQNSKAKLTLECEGVVTCNGRATLGKKKADDSDSSTNPLSGGQSAARKASTPSEEGSLKVCPSVPDSGGNTTHVEALTFTGKKFVEESINAHKSLQSVGLASHTSATGMLPMLSAPVFGMPSTQHSYVSMIMPPPQQLLPSIIVTHPASPSGISQPHQLEQQQPMVRSHAELLPMPPHLSNFQQSQTNQQPSLQQLQQLRGIADLGPQPIQWQQQQLQLAIDQVSHNLRHVLNQQQQLQSNQPISSQALNQLSLTSSQGVGSHFASAKFSPSAQQSDLHQSQLYQIQSNPQLLPQQQEQALQLQLMQLHWQQQQSQLQQVQSQALMEVQAQARIQTEETQAQSHHKIYVPMNEQQQMVPFKEFMHSSPRDETIRQCELDCPSLIKSHHSISEDAHVSQSSETLNTAQTIQDVHHVKLFGQSLFLQTDSCNQQPNSKVTPTSPPALISGRSQTDDTRTKVSTNALNLGHTPPQNSWSTPSVNGGLIGKFEHQHQEMTSPRMSNKVTHLHDTDENRISDVSFSNPNPVEENQCDSGALENGILFDPANSSSIQPTEMSDMTVNKKVLQDSSNSTKILNGQPIVTQALPRVIDALVALAEWRLQNSSGGSGKLTDEFLSQSWEALQRDPSAFLEAGKASESLAQLCSGGAEMLQQLKDGFIHRNADVSGTIKARDVDEKPRAPSE